MEELNEEEMKGVEGGACKSISSASIVVSRKRHDAIFIMRPDADIQVLDIYMGVRSMQFSVKNEGNRMRFFLQGTEYKPFVILDIVFSGIEVMIKRNSTATYHTSPVTKVRIKFSFKHGLGVATKIFKF